MNKILLLLIFGTVITGCAHVVPLKPDSRWHTVYSLQIPSKSIELEFETVSVPRPACKKNRIPEKTEIRILLLESFQNLDALPDRIEDTVPRADGIPIVLADSGPYDMTLIGARRIIPLITGKQIVARSSDGCVALKIKDLSADSKK